MLGRIVPNLSQQIKDPLRRNRDANIRSLGLNHRYNFLRIHRRDILRVSHKKGVKKQRKDDPAFLEHPEEANQQLVAVGPRVCQQIGRWAIWRDLLGPRLSEEYLHGEDIEQGTAGGILGAEVYQ